MSLALYASASNHVFGQMLGLPGSCVLLPYVPYHQLMQHQENYCDCAPVRLGEHLSGESRKLTVMIQRETGQPLDRPWECLEFLRFDEGPFPSQACTHPEIGRVRSHQGLSSSLTVKLLWLSESVKAL